MLYLTDVRFYLLVLAECRLNKSWLHLEFIAANDFELKGLLTLNGYHYAIMLNYHRKQKVSQKKELHQFMPRKLDISEYCWTVLCNTRFLAQTNMFLIYCCYLLPTEIQPNWLHLILTQYALAETNIWKRSLYQEKVLHNAEQLSSLLARGNYLIIFYTCLLSSILEALLIEEGLMK